VPDVVNEFGGVAGLWMRLADLLTVRERHRAAVGGMGGIFGSFESIGLELSNSPGGP